MISGAISGWGDVLIPYFTLAVRVETDAEVRIERLRKRERDHFGSRIDPGGDRTKSLMFYISMFGEGLMVYFFWRFVEQQKEKD